MYKKWFFLAICVCVFTAGQVGLAELSYYQWQDDYTSPPPKHTLAAWSFNEDTVSGTTAPAFAYDLLSGATRAATLSGWASFGEGGKFGWGFHNVGDEAHYAEDRADVSNSYTLFPTGADPSISVECWVKFNILSLQQQYIADKAYTDKSGFKFFLYRDPYVRDPGIAEPDYRLAFIVGNDVNSVDISTILSWETNRWYHIAGTWDAATDTGKLFRDGIEVFSTSYVGMSIVDASGGRPLRIGNRRGSTYWPLNGTIDNLRISDVAYAYKVSDPQECGDYGTVYLPGDISGPYGERDCHVDFYDFAKIAANWVLCSDPADSSCDVNWK